MRRALVGLSTPIGYDYGHDPDGHDYGDIPNPVLENVTGLLLCYDEIWFVSRALCPIDMRDLPYVRFVDEDEDLCDRALVAAEQFHLPWHEIAEMPWARGGDYRSAWEAVTSAAPFLRLDNHSRTIGPFGQQGNAADAQLYLQDVGIATSLDMELDVVTNSVMADSLRSGGTPTGLTQWHLDLAESTILLRTTDLLTPTGAYHESIEDLRSHKQLGLYRSFLAEADEGADITQLVEEINLRVERHLAESHRRFVKGAHPLRTLGLPAIGIGINTVLPPLGTVVSGGTSGALALKERIERRSVAWSLFVAEARLTRHGR